MEAQRQQKVAMLRQMIDDKRCSVCKNTFIINDQVTFCSINKECVDDKNGMSCEHFEPLNIEV